MYATTKEWLMDSLIMNSDSCITRNGILWRSVAGFSRHGSIFAIYENDNKYCVHAGNSDKWEESEEPIMGYYDKPLTYDDLISKIANTYDKIREKVYFKYAKV